ncbi:MAG: TetR/AcrR family transcriptional regulator [Oscillospiraceae bacterium]|nr:TetR/AcrR family transcriptional regulator [Oscillospiraceae bacterium]
MKEATKTKLLQAAISEIEVHGITDLSVRRIAEQCGMSPGAPYRHFADKNELILEVLKYVTGQWAIAQHAVLMQSDITLREQLVELCVAYIRFLCDNPEFQTILMMNDRALSPAQREEKSKFTQPTRQLIEQYCRSVNMNAEQERRKLFAVRTVLYGAAFIINTGTEACREQALQLTRQLIEREFDLP